MVIIANYYQIRSPLSQITEEKMNLFISSLSDALGETLNKVSLDEYINSDFSLLYVASGGSEGYFIEIFDQLKDKPCYILTSGDSNSLAASMEILSFIHQNGGNGEILHGDINTIAKRIKGLQLAYKAKSSLIGKNIGIIGKSSDWLIASTFSQDKIKSKLGIGFVEISIDELISEINKKNYDNNEYTQELLQKNFDKGEINKALEVYGAVKRLCNKYNLCGVSIRCFDLLDTVHTTGCLALAILNAEGIYGGCEGDIPALLSMVILGEVSGKPCFLCNPSRFDTEAGTAIFAHCTIPLNMIKSYELNTHFESGIGIAIQGKFEKDNCTLFKCSGDLSRYYTDCGEILDMPFNNMLCRTQIKLSLNDFSYFLTNPINNHHIICYGDYTQSIKDFFALI